MTLSAAAIIEELKTAFPAKRSKRFVRMVNSVCSDEPFLIEAEFTDKDDWTKLTPEWLNVVPNGLASALSFLSNEAIRFYIPAFLAADLNGALDRVDPTFTLFHGFDNSYAIDGFHLPKTRRGLISRGIAGIISRRLKP